MTAIEKLIAIEAIKVLKAQYCRLLDRKQWEQWAALYTPDATVGTDADGSEDASGVLTGRDNIVRWVRKRIEKAVTIHRVYGPEIEVLGPRQAKGVWAMDDQVIFPDTMEGPFRTLRGFGHYREEYELQESRWRIKTLRLSRLREEIV